MADLSAFATKEMADEGVILPVKVNGHKLPLAIKVYGDDSDVVKEFDRSKIRKLKIGKNGKQGLDEDDIDDFLDSEEQAVVIRIGGLYTYDWEKGKVNDKEPVKWGEKVLENTPASYKFLITQIPAIKEWVREQAKERDNFLESRKAN